MKVTKQYYVAVYHAVQSTAVITFEYVDEMFKCDLMQAMQILYPCQLIPMIIRRSSLFFLYKR